MSNLLLLSACLVLIGVSLVCFARGIIKKSVYYEPNSPPVEFRIRPLRVIAICALYLAMGAFFAYGAILISKAM